MSRGTKETVGAFLERKAGERRAALEAEAATVGGSVELRVEEVRPRSVARTKRVLSLFFGVRYAIVSKGGKVLGLRERREEALEVVAANGSGYVFDAATGKAFAAYHVIVAPRGSFGV